MIVPARAPEDVNKEIAYWNERLQITADRIKKATVYPEQDFKDLDVINCSLAKLHAFKQFKIWYTE